MRSQAKARIARKDPPANAIVVGDALATLRQFRPRTFQACVTSPPYWGLRDYGVEGQIGTEDSLEDYLTNLRRVFAEVRRVLRDDGVLWLNIGDSYTSGNRGWRATDKRNGARGMDWRPPTPKGLKDKELVGIPWRVALMLQKQGWYLRSDVIWSKPNTQPESVKDRPTLAHEYVFLFSKRPSYFYDHEAVMEQANGSGVRNRRSVWNINTEPYPGAHFATFPRELVRLCVLAGSAQGDLILDPFFGAGTVGLLCQEHSRDFLGIEISPKYAKLAAKRLGLGRRQIITALVEDKVEATLA